MKYCPSLFAATRRLTREVMVGSVGLGGAHPIRVQSMLTCDTMDTAACIAQTEELVEAGCEIVRITAPTVKDAANLEHIVAGLRAKGIQVPIVADIHFKPDATKSGLTSGNTQTRNTPPSWTGFARNLCPWWSCARPAAWRCGSAPTTAPFRTGS